MKKYTKTDGPAEVLSPEQHNKAEDALHKMGKTSAQELSEEEREEFDAALSSDQ